MYKRILVPVDGSSPANCGVDEAGRLAKLTGGQIRILHVIDQAPLLGLDWSMGLSVENLQLMREDGLAILYAAASRVQNTGLQVSTVLATNVSLRLADQVLDQADDWQADLIVLGTHSRRGVPRKLLGGDADDIIRLVNIPLLFVRGSLHSEAHMHKAAPTVYEEHA